MSNREPAEQASHDESSPSFAPWIAKIFYLFFGGVSLTVSFILFQEGQQGALFVALIAGAMFWVLESLENKSRSSTVPGWIAAPRSFAIVGIIAIVAFVASLPTLHIYFLEDDFAFLHAFYHLSPAQFFQLFHMDLGQFVWGDSRQEFRPLYSLFYVAAYHIWGLRPLGYHLCQILIHALVSILVFLIVKALAPDDPRRAGLAAILFAVQPPHAQAMSLIVGLVAESLPAVFYLSAFLFFIHFRSSGRSRYLAMSVAAFIACLLIKESAVTLPVILVFYDLFRAASGDTLSSRRDKSARWRNRMLPYVPYAILLSVYLGWRRKVFASYLREANWGKHAPEIVASPDGFWVHFSHFASRTWQLQVFNFQTLFPYSVPILGLILGIFLIWSISLLRRRKRYGRSMAQILFFGVAWYLISNLPYLIETHVTYHLYLPEAGFCIGGAFLALPNFCARRDEGRYSRLLSIGVLVVVSVTQMWKGERDYQHLGEMSDRMTGQLATGLNNIPKGELVVVWPDNSSLVASGWGEEIVPFSVQPPFTATDEYSNIRVIEHPDMSCCGVGEWWEKIGPVLGEEATRPPGNDVALYLLSWDDRTAAFSLEERTMRRKLLIDRVTATLGGPPESVQSIDDAEAIRLVRALTELVKEGGASPIQN